MFRTPIKGNKDADTRDIAAGSETVTKSSLPLRPNVRRSIGEWESGAPDARHSLTPPQRSPKVETLKPRPAAARKMSPGAAEAVPKAKSQDTKRVKEARACVCSAKTHLSNSRNIKTEIKVAVNAAIDRLFQLVKEADADSRGGTDAGPCPPKQVPTERRQGGTCAPSEPLSAPLEGVLKEHMRLLWENTARMELLKQALETRTVSGGHDDGKLDQINTLLGEVRELRQTTEATGRRVSCLQEAIPSYAEVLARPSGAVTPTKLRPKHSIIVSSEDDRDTSETVLGQVREALDAKTSGLKVTRVQKVKNGRLVLSCDTRDELDKISKKITTQTKKLTIEEARNKDPLIIIKNILSVHRDEEIVTSLKTQNTSVLGTLKDEEFRAVVKYRRRARNPHENHVVLQVSPKMWQKLTAAKRVHVDLQYAAVQDQSPLVQCTRCLGYGHGRRLCTEPVDLCSHCADPHLRADCPAYTTGETATCRNCRLAKYHELGHNAFDGECPVRKRWDAIARSSVAYC